MPTELEELLGFLHAEHAKIREIAAENAVGYSAEQPAAFKTNAFKPIADLKNLVARSKENSSTIVGYALDMLVNLSSDKEVLQKLVEDEAFVETLLARVTNRKESNADLVVMLIANLAKSDDILKLIDLKREIPDELSTSPYALDQLLDLFVRGYDGAWNNEADFDYLCYAFADIARRDEGRRYFLTPRDADRGIVPLSKILVFTDHKSDLRRLGVASTIKNSCFDIDAHSVMFMSTDEGGVNLLPYILLPLMGPEEYDDEDSEGMLDEVQLLPPDKEREKDNNITKVHMETLLLLTSSRPGRERLRAIKTYPIVRNLHANTEDEKIRDLCDRFVQLTMRGEEGQEAKDVPWLNDEHNIPIGGALNMSGPGTPVGDPTFGEGTERRSIARIEELEDEILDLEDTPHGKGKEREAGSGADSDSETGEAARQRRKANRRSLGPEDHLAMGRDNITEREKRATLNRLSALGLDDDYSESHLSMLRRIGEQDDAADEDEDEDGEDDDDKILEV